VLTLGPWKLRSNHLVVLFLILLHGEKHRRR
jgi:hypothetical protein